jgi:hypothetical protein
MRSMTHIKPRNPYDKAILGEQDSAIGQLWEFAGRPNYSLPHEQILGRIVLLSRILQPATEGLARTFPTLATHYVDNLHNYCGGKLAYETWMKQQPYFSEDSSELYVSTSRAALVLSQEYQDEVSLRSVVLPYTAENSTKCRTPHVISLANNYKKLFLTDYMPFFEDELADSDATAIYRHMPFQPEEEHRFAEPGIITSNLSRHAALIYEQHGTLGLAQYNISNLLATLREDLVDMNLMNS